MQPLKIGIQLKSLKLPFKKAVVLAKQLGAEAVEIDARGELRPGTLSQTGLREVRRLLTDLGLKVAAVGFETRRGYDNAEELEARVDATKQALEFAYQLGTSVVVNQIGRVPADDKSPTWQTLVTVLSDIAHAGNRAGAWLAAETGAEPPGDLKRLLAVLPEGGVGITFDPGNLAVAGFSSADAIAELGSLVRYVHAKDGVRDVGKGRGVEVPLGRGTADLPYVLAALEDFGYRGFVTVERDHADDPAFEIGQAVKYLKNLGD